MGVMNTRSSDSGSCGAEKYMLPLGLQFSPNLVSSLWNPLNSIPSTLLPSPPATPTQFVVRGLSQVGKQFKFGLRWV